MSVLTRDDAFLPAYLGLATDELQRLGCRVGEVAVLPDEVWVSLANGTYHAKRESFLDGPEAVDWARVVASLEMEIEA